ncbi:hypothetical protein BC829DRAFT_17985 [Chytridium lagenaria]|nr:hypothetical protein BC829DRAFT_17985 [Chytridium lagenaria]
MRKSSAGKRTCRFDKEGKEERVSNTNQHKNKNHEHRKKDKKVGKNPSTSHKKNSEQK